MATDVKNPTKGKTDATPPANGDGTKKLEAEVEQLKATNQQLQTQIGEVQSVMVSPQFQEFMKSKNQPAQQYDRSAFAAGRQQEFDEALEAMSRTDLVRFIMSNVGQTIQSQISPQISKLSTDRLRDELARGIKDAKGKYKDFDNFTVQMGQTATRLEKSGITADDLYKITTHPGAKKADDGDGDKPGTQTTEKPGGAGGELKVEDDKETPQETAGRIFEELKLGDKKA